MSADEISFNQEYNSYCICFIDMIDSTKVIANISTSDKVRKYYSIFLNSMSDIIRSFDGKIIKNAGDCLIFYFPKTLNFNNAPAFRDVLECGTTMTAAFKVINSKLSENKLPSVNYRISADYGKAIIAKSASSDNYDLFGPTMNICSKINSKAPPNGMVIGNDLYQVLKSFFSSKSISSQEYKFKNIGQYSIPGLKQSYPIYSVIINIKYTNKNIASLQGQEAILIEPHEEQGQGQGEKNNLQHVLIIDDEPDTAFVYKSILNQEGYTVNTFTDPKAALRHFSQLPDPNYYKLILLDIRMPEVNGIQLFYRFKAINPNVRIIFVTALDIGEDELEAVIPGFSSDGCGLMRKPVTKENYVDKIKAYLE